MEPTWLRIIRVWCAQPGRTGPTFPFVFGATRQPVGAPVEDEANAQTESTSLLSAMKVHCFAGEYLAVRECSMIRQPVISIQRDYAPKTGPWSDLSIGVDGLHISLPPLSSEEAEEQLWIRSRDAILLGRYSFNRENRASSRWTVPIARSSSSRCTANYHPGSLTSVHTAPCT